LVFRVSRKTFSKVNDSTEINPVEASFERMEVSDDFSTDDMEEETFICGRKRQLSD
jgi:hypothetical protein